jgi:hypothetical protein
MIYSPVHNHFAFMKTKLICIITWTLILFSCRQPKGKPDSETVKEGNKSTTFSTDTAKLSKLIDLKVYKPTHARFKYTFIDNSGQNERLSIPGPSDSYLQALLYFDSSTFNQLKKNYFNVDYPSPNYNRFDFGFDWLDADVKKELMQSDTGYHGHPDYFLGSGGRGKLWLLKNRVLVIISTS